MICPKCGLKLNHSAICSNCKYEIGGQPMRFLFGFSPNELKKTYRKKEDSDYSTEHALDLLSELVLGWKYGAINAVLSRWHNTDVCTEAMLGLTYYYASFDEINYDEAFQWFKAGEKKGDKVATYYLAHCYSFGLGTVKNLTLGEELYKRSAEDGIIEAYLMLGLRAYGRFPEENIVIDYGTAVKCFEKSARGGISQADALLAECFLYGRGVKKNRENAKKLIEHAKLSANSFEEFNQIGLFYYQQNINKEEPIDDRNSALNNMLFYFRKAQSYKPEEGSNNLGMMYYNGSGVKQDYDIAADYFKRAAESNNRTAMRNLAICYMTGLGVSESQQRSAEWLDKSEAIPITPKSVVSYDLSLETDEWALEIKPKEISDIQPGNTTTNDVSWYRDSNSERDCSKASKESNDNDDPFDHIFKIFNYH